MHDQIYLPILLGILINMVWPFWTLNMSENHVCTVVRMYDLCASKHESQFSIIECAFGHGYLRTHIGCHFVIVEHIVSIPQESVSHDSPSSSSSLSEFSGSDGDSDEEVSIPVQIDVHCKVMATENQPVPVQLVKNISQTVVEMARMKQTAKKQGTQGSLAKFGGGGGGKGKGKAAKQLVLQTVGVAARHCRCKDRCLVMPHGAPADASTGRKKCYMPGTKSLLEITYYQKRVGLLISKLSFQ